MKRSRLKSKPYVPKESRQWTGHVTDLSSSSAVMNMVSPNITPQPKTNYLRSEDYRRAVAALPCANCEIEGYSQCAHADEGKGTGIKSSDERCFPLCGPHPVRWTDGMMIMHPGCHYMIGSSGRYTQASRRILEKEYSEQTRAKLLHLLYKS